MSDNNLLGKTLGTCTLQKLVGRGGMGAVYLAQQARPRRLVAVKVLLPDLIDGQKYSEFLARFRREADIVAQLQQVNIIPIYEYGEQDSIPFLVMPFLAKGSLQQVLSQRHMLPLDDIMSYISQAAAALDYAHAHHVLHRDLKPANFLLADDGRLVLTDFGIARLSQNNPSSTSSATLTRADTILGTPQYMAPEMFMGETVDYRADIYALGIILYQMLGGQVPFKGDTFYTLARMHVQDAPPSLLPLRADLPQQIDIIIQTALAKAPENRFQSAGALAQALQHVLTPTLNTDSSMMAEKTLPATPFPFVAPSAGGKVEQAIEMRFAGPNSVNTVRNTTGAGQPVTTAGAFSTTTQATTNRQQPLLIFIGLLLILVLVVGGVLVGLQLNKGNVGTVTPPQPRVTQPAKLVTTAVTATSQPRPTVAVTATPNSPRITPTSQVTSVPKGSLLYSATSPGAASGTGNACDNGGEQWVDYNTPTVLCQQTGTQISNPHGNAPDLVGTFLASLPSGQFSLSNYVIETTIQQAQSSNADFGIYFRNQPGNQQGVYTFLVHPNGTWSAYIYNNTTAARTEISNGTFGNVHASVTIDVVVNGADFSFYANGHKVGSVNNGIYSTGTVGLAVDASGTILASNFALYQPT